MTQKVNIRFYQGALALYDVNFGKLALTKTANIVVHSAQVVADVAHVISVLSDDGSTLIPLAAVSPMAGGLIGLTGVQAIPFSLSKLPVITKADGSPASPALFIAAVGDYLDMESSNG